MRLQMPGYLNVTVRSPWVDAAEGVVFAILFSWLLGILGLWATWGVNSLRLLVALGIGTVLGLLRAQRVLLVGDLLLLALIGVIAFTPVINAPMARWVRQDSLPANPVSVAVVLASGTVQSDSTLDAEGIGALLAGLELVRAGRAERLVTTRIVKRFGERVVSSDSDQRRIVRLARADSVWHILPGVVATTRDEALTAARTLLPQGFDTVAVIAWPPHTRRACATFEAVGFVVYCVSASGNHNVSLNLVTAADRLAAFREYVYERLGNWKYRTNGWLRAS